MINCNQNENDTEKLIIYTFFYKVHFYNQRQAELGKKSS